MASSYNAGPHRTQIWLPEEGSVEADRWIDTIPFSETRRYVRAVLAYMTIFNWRRQQIELNDELELSAAAGHSGEQDGDSNNAVVAVEAAATKSKTSAAQSAEKPVRRMSDYLTPINFDADTTVKATDDETLQSADSS